MQKLTFINAQGREAVFTDSPPFIFWEIRGLDIPELSEVSTQASGQHGYTLHDVLVDGRTVRLSCHIHGPDGIKQMYEMRRRLNFVCNPMLGLGELIYENDYGRWRVECYVNANPYARKLRNIQTLDISFRCPSGLLESAEQYLFSLAFIEGGAEFPLITPTEFGLFGYQTDIVNDGDVLTPVEITMDGGGLNPIIRNRSTGQFIKVDKQIAYYEKLYINTDPERQKVQIASINPATNKTVFVNAYGYLSDDSELFGLVPGNNSITFNSDDEENKHVQIRGVYRKRYIGV